MKGCPQSTDRGRESSPFTLLVSNPISVPLGKRKVQRSWPLAMRQAHCLGYLHGQEESDMDKCRESWVG